MVRLNAPLAASVCRKADNIHEMRVFDATAAVVIPVLQRMIADGASKGTLDMADAGLLAEITVGPGPAEQRQTLAEL